ncbi:MAG TPA: N,N-dimethylformamidase beta subunit family domain-containing protein [Candidatus Binatia bacterium]|jgi:N,N-dimethylformamidase|nr:N,N-dimethylformamidase beta subunit family domain-containing protein [Candidatus Binatia bacterium]
MKITGYGDKLSAAPGETIRFMVNCELPRYTAEVVRIICGDTNPKGPGVKEKVVKTPVNNTYKGRKQTIEAGSYVTIPSSPLLENLGSFSVQAMIWPTTPEKGRQILMAKFRDRDKSGMALVITERDGSIGLVLGDGRGNEEVITTGKPLLAREWYFVAASYNAETREVTLYQEPLVPYPLISDAAEVHTKTKIAGIGGNQSPFMFAAFRSGSGRAKLDGKYNGKLDRPRLANRVLSRAEMEMLKQGPVPTQLSSAVVGAWDFSRDISSLKVTDRSPNLLHGEVVNMPARGMKGYNWTGEVMNWQEAPEQYGAIHFHDDDLFDAGWDVDFELEIPTTLRSGLYAARLRAGEEEDYIPFVVKPAPGKEKQIAFLLPTASYMAYANEHFATNADLVELIGGRLAVLDRQDLFLNEHREYGASCYDSHADRSGVCYSSRLRPILNMRPKHTSTAGGFGSMLWQFNADTHITDWLEAMGYEFDVITDEDLHYQGFELLKPYGVILTGSHPEYHSRQMWDAMMAYQQHGGRLMYMGANGWYWRIAYHPQVPGLIEVRRNEGGIRSWAAEPGEYYHSFTGEYGGLWRRQGRPPQMIVGTGFTAQGFDISAPYRRLLDSFNPRAAFIFAGIGEAEIIGDFGLIGGGAAGLELDRADRQLGTPPHALVLATSKGGHTDIYLVVCEEILMTHPGLGGSENELVRADMVFYETPNGGAVWSASSIAWTGSLSHNNYDNNVSRITNKVLTRFLDPRPLVK